jgi:hypothetical protein
VFKVSLVVDARRFRLGDEKESAGVADAVIQVGIMEIECPLAGRINASVIPSSSGDDDGNWQIGA